MIQGMNISAAIAVGGQQAVDLVRERFKDMDRDPHLMQFKLIFMDYSMPEVDGIDASTQILNMFRVRGIYPGHEDWPYITCLSAYSDPSYVERALDNGI